MKNKENQTELLNQAKELIKPRRAEDVFAANAEVEALCSEFGSGTDCRIGNSSINPNEDSLLF
ncbi:hypothetical protein [Pedobacter sp. GR22-10]|uniref:hypothetical protein n=1 Tax=Pedobacter sp. GR22-10 TaxID=2994472 RepID=UPI0022456229|nr:hypothetical protein [Pedobacter sp. GR22-10]MCX2431619.1 hypothetical protein [Pedobacter sp. GR22-10]